MAALGVVISGGALAAFMKFGILDRAQEKLSFLPWVGWEDFWFTAHRGGASSARCSR